MAVHHKLMSHSLHATVAVYNHKASCRKLTSDADDVCYLIKLITAVLAMCSSTVSV